MTFLRSVSAFAVALAIPLAASAQEGRGSWEGRGFFTFNVGGQTASPEFAFEHGTTLFAEPATAGLNTPGRSGLTFDVGGGLRIVQNLGVGVTYSRYDKTRDATLTTTIPSPLFYGDPSTVEQTIPLNREEDAVHIQAIYKIPITRKVQAGVFGGPTFFRCLDDSVASFTLNGQFSGTYDWSVQFQQVNQTIEKDSSWGYHAGGDVTYLVTPHVGIGVTARWSHASHKFANPLSDTGDLYSDATWGGPNTTTEVTMKHGGMQWTGGVSLRF